MEQFSSNAFVYNANMPDFTPVHNLVERNHRQMQLIRGFNEYEEALADDPATAYEESQIEPHYPERGAIVYFQVLNNMLMMERTYYGLTASPREFVFDDWYVSDSDSESEDIQFVDYEDSDEEGDDPHFLCQ